MTSYVVLKILHVLVAVLGLGQAGALFVASWQKPVATPLTLRIAQIVAVSLLIMLLSGIGLMKMSGWSFAPTLWIRGSFFLMLIIGFSASRIVKAGRSVDQSNDFATILRRHSTIIAVLAGTIVWLMTAKPF